MKVVYEYSHLGGRQILQMDHPSIYQDIHHTIASIGPVEKTKLSGERTKVGQLLYSPKSLNSAFAEKFRQLGYRELKDQYHITIPHYNAEAANVHGRCLRRAACIRH